MAEETTQEFTQEQAVVEQTNAANISARTVEMHRATADAIHAEKSVTIRQGAAKEIRAHEVSIRQGAVLTLDADGVTITQGGAGLVRSAETNLGPGSTSAAIIADTVSLDQAAAQFVLARDTVEMDQSAAALLIGQHVTAKDSTAMLMFANTVEGNVHVAMDRQAAITFGAALGATLGLFLAVFGLLKRK
jgi:hypothetical protein